MLNTRTQIAPELQGTTKNEETLYLALKNGPTPASFCLFSFFSNSNFTEKTLDVSGIRTRIVGVEGKYADHWTTNTTHVGHDLPP